MRTRNVAILTVIVIVVTAFITHLVDTGMSNISKAQSLIEKITNGKVVIVKHFRSVANLEGFVIHSKGTSKNKGLLYADKRGRYVISGTIITDKMQDLAQVDYLKYLQPKGSAQLIKQASQTNWLQQGKASAPHKLYAVIDPNCIFCHRFYETIQPQIKAGTVSVRWIIAGFIKPSSRGKALAILGAKDPLQALAENEAKFNEKIEEGGATPLKNADTITTSKYIRNQQFVTSHKINETPTLLYTSTKGKNVLRPGAVQTKGMAKFLAQVGKTF